MRTGELPTCTIVTSAGVSPSFLRMYLSRKSDAEPRRLTPSFLPRSCAALVIFFETARYACDGSFFRLASITRSEPESAERSEEHTSELQSRFGISYAVFC